MRDVLCIYDYGYEYCQCIVCAAYTLHRKNDIHIILLIIDCYVAKILGIEMHCLDKHINNSINAFNIIRVESDYCSPKKIYDGA